MKLLLALALVLSGSGPADSVAALRAQGPSALAPLLERYRALPAGAERDALEATIDAVAAQRYATVSGLYWYTDLAQAEAAARVAGKPILSLRMLGRLDEDLSCANSRFFRVVLYANADVSAFLRDNFVLHWSSERPVPKVTIDFGNGRTIHTTLAGNSAHYVLDADGRVLDVLPGLYSPGAFRRELEALLALARQSPGLDDAERMHAVLDAQRAHDASVGALWGGVGRLVEPAPAAGIVAAEAVAFSKSRAETPLLSGLLPPLQPWPEARVEEARLDQSSRRLFERLEPADGDRQVLSRFEESIAIDTQQNETALRPRIHALMQSGATLPGFEELNERIYREIFLTPREDEWLGLRAPGTFNALPDGGLSR